MTGTTLTGLGTTLTGRRVDRSVPHGLPGLVREAATAGPSRIALVDQDRTISYAELERLSDAVAEAVDAIGGEPGRPVAVRLPRGADLVVAMLGVLKSGRPYLPLGEDHPPERIAAMVAAAEPVAFIGDDDGTGGLAEARPGLARIELPRSAGTVERPLPPVNFAQPAYVMFTSGSTGRPKGVLQHSGGLCNRLLWMRDAYSVGPDDRVLQKTPCTFDVSGWEIWLPLIVGARCVLLPPGAHRDPAEIRSWIERHRVTLCHFVPSLLEEFLRRLPTGACRSLRHVVCSGEALPEAVAARAHELLPARLHNLYGPTEAAIDVTAWEVPREPARMLIGEPIDNVDLHVVDGELWIGGDAVALGYVNAPELTGEAFTVRDGARLYRTGDRVRVVPGGLEYLGRLDDQVKIRGVRIEPAEVERVLEAHPAIRRAVVVKHGSALAALFVAAADVPDQELLREFAARSLPAGFVPSVFVPADGIPLGPTGKVDRAAAARLVADRPAPARQGTPEGSWRALLPAWAEALDIPESAVDPDLDFLSAGGHSLAAARIIGAVRAGFGVRLPFATLLDERVSLRELAGRLPGRGAAETGAPVPPGGGRVPMPPGLRRLWLLERLYPSAAAAYNVVDVSEIDEDLGPDAFASLVDRHDVLRMSVVEEDGDPYLTFAEPGTVTVPLAVAEAVSPAELAAEPVPRQAPMMRAWLVRDGGRTLLVLVLSHLIGDQSTLDILREELLAGADAGAGDRPALTFEEYTRRSLAAVDGPAWRADLDFWTERLGGAPVPLDLPTARRRPEVPSFRCHESTLTIPAERWAGIVDAAARCGGTPANLMLACFAALLHSWTGQPDVRIGVPADARRTPAEQRLAGMLVDTLVLRTRTDDATTLRDLAGQARTEYLEAVEHSSVSFDAVVEALRIPAVPGRNPVFQAWFNDLSRSRGSDAPPVTAALFDVGVYLRRRGAERTVAVVVAADLFDEAFAAEFATQLGLLVDRAVTGPDRPLSETALGAAPPAPPALPAAAARRSLPRIADVPTDRPAIVGPGTTMTYGELEDAVDALAGRLEAGALVAVEAVRSPLLPVAMLGVRRAGGTLALIAADAPAAYRNTCLETLGAAVRLTLDGGEIHLEGKGDAAPDGASHVLFTSGTTGAPRAVRIGRGVLDHCLAEYAEAFALGADDRFAMLSGAAHDPIFRDVLPALALGASVHVPPPDPHRDPGALADWIAEREITVLHATPALLGLITATGRRLPALRLVVSGGDILTAGLARRLRRATDATIVNAYGATETPQLASCAVVPGIGPDWPDSRELPIGTGFGGRRVLVVSPDGRPLENGRRGEVLVTGDDLADGHGTAYRTGDVGYRWTDGVVITGRLDRQVMVDGHRVELGSVEHAARGFAGVDAARAALVDTPAGRVLALTVLAGDPDLGMAGLRAHLRTVLPGPAVPSRITRADLAGLETGRKLAPAPRAVLAPADPARADHMPADPARADPARELEQIVTEVLGAPIRHDVSFFDAGLTSVSLVRIHEVITERFAADLPVTAVFAHPTITALAGHLGRGARGAAPARHTDGDVNMDAIAVVGLAGRFPGASDVTEFWANLAAGRSGVTWQDEETLRALGVPARTLADPDYVRAVPLLPHAEEFDAELFGLTPREAMLRDPQQRAFLETVHAGLENAGYAPFAPDTRVGVFGGAAANRYAEHHLLHNPGLGQLDGLTLDTTNNGDYVATIASYRLDLRGPSVTVATACSTSLVALHLAGNALRAGECDLAVAGAAELEFPYAHGYKWYPGSIYSRDGVCRPFDADANGTIFGSGVGVVVLKRLRDALADGDTIRAIVLGSAVNNDGADKVSFSAPSVSGQKSLVLAAMKAAGVHPRDVGYIEAHGTGTMLGDPIEITGLAEAYAEAGGAAPGSCPIGSVKSNIGHLGPAAGVAGLIKTILAMEHGKIPASINYRRPNPRIGFEDTPFYVNDQLSDWPGGDRPRIAGVSSFGVGGTNAHVIIQEPPASPPRAATGRLQLVVWSARDRAPLGPMRERLAASFAELPEGDFEDAARTLQRGRTHHRVRAAVVAASSAEAAALLTGEDRNVLTGGAGRPLCFLFPGQGAQDVRMAAGLYGDEAPAFSATMDACLETLRECDLDLRPVWLDRDPAAVRHTAAAQPLLMAVQYAMAQELGARGIVPDVVLGHSIGELVAATIAGVFDIKDALHLVAARSRPMGEMAGGAMLAVAAGRDDLDGLIEGPLAIAAVNAPRQVVVSGPVDAVESLARRLAEEGTPSQLLRTSHGFHSPMMEQAAQRFESAFDATHLRPPRIPLVSAATGVELTDEQARSPRFWARQIVEPVLFGAALDRLLDRGPHLMLEMGPGQTLTALCRQHPAVVRGDSAVVGTAPRRASEPDELRQFLTAVGAVHVEGHDVRWPDGPHRRLPLPGYAYQRKRHWADASPAKSSAEAPAPAPAEPEPATPFSVLSWREAPAATAVRERGRRALALVPADREPRLAVLGALHAGGHRVFRVKVGDEPRIGEEEFVVRRGEAGDLREVFEELARRQLLPQVLVHGLGMAAWEPPTAANCGDQVMEAFDSLAALARIGARYPVGGERSELVVLSSSALDVTGGEIRHPVKSMAVGFVRSLAEEGGRAAFVDVLPGTGQAHLADELLRPGGIVALRGARRWEPFERPLEPAAGTEAVRDEGVYLVTGGLGGLGLEVATALARTGKRPRLVLLARRGPDDLPARAGALIEEMRELGAEVKTVRADLADARQVRRALDIAEATFGPVNGVVHCAGVPGGGVVELRDPADSARVLRPKVLGTLVLQEQLARRARLDFFAAFSSRSGTHGLFGSADYAAANSFLDAQMAAGALAGRMVSIGWPSWSEVGMAAGPAPLLAETLSDRTHWTLDEHRIDGRPVQPGTAHIDMFLRALRSRGEGPGLRLDDITFLVPLIADRPREVQVVEEGDRLVIRSRETADEEWTSHAMARAVAAEPDAANAADLAALRAGMADPPVRAEDEAAVMVQVGPRWRNRGEILRGPDADLVEVVLPPEFAADLADHVLHPAQLDWATAAAQHRPGTRHLPFLYESLVVHGSLPERFWSHLRYRSRTEDAIVADIDLIAEDGTVLVQITAFTMRRVDRAAFAAAAPPPRPPGRADARDGLAPATGTELFMRLLRGRTPEHVLVRPYRDGEPTPLEPGRAPAATAPVAAPETLPAPTTPTQPTTPAAPPGPAAVPQPPQGGASGIADTLRGFWTEALGVTEIGPDDDFFELGGNSLVAVQVMTRIRERFGVELSIGQFFEHPTIKLFAGALERGDAA
ncbi:amino acid adenylation domain-containing protein [Actinomadura sp. NTSP31]|uniref:amino acid adenylation domain-containing protein n=1 Tax=Actinomadura sp. NTSP31 TaxID=1735447 RepID=UPI0035C26195